MENIILMEIFDKAGCGAVACVCSVNFCCYWRLGMWFGCELAGVRAAGSWGVRDGEFGSLVEWGFGLTIGVQILFSMMSFYCLLENGDALMAGLLFCARWNGISSSWWGLFSRGVDNWGKELISELEIFMTLKCFDQTTCRSAWVFEGLLNDRINC